MSGRVRSLAARLKAAPTDAGGFVAVASTGDLDRDGERIQKGCFRPLPESVPVHLDHGSGAKGLVGRGRPYYDGDKLMIEAVFASTPDAQTARQKVVDGVLTSMSIVFLGVEWANVDGVRTCVSGELLACDLVSIPANSGARILSSRSARLVERDLSADVLLTMARAELALAQIVLDQSPKGDTGRVRRQADAFLRSLLKDATPDVPTFDGRTLRRNLFNTKTMEGPK